MALDFGKLNDGAAVKQIEPRKIFSTLKRDSRFKRPLDEQADVLDAWFLRRTSKDLTIKMNTGGGKTVVGLLCLQSSLNEGIKPAVYIASEPFLAEQVITEAGSLGIPVTSDEKDPEFIRGRSILVVNVHKLFNGRSVFGVAEKKIPIGSVVIDDAHACLSVVTAQFKISADSKNIIYRKLLELFEEDLKSQTPSDYLDLKAGDAAVVMQVPYWAWQKKNEEVIGVLHKERNSQSIGWSWPLLKDCIPQCMCVFGGAYVEIAPRFVPIDRIPSFDSAARRIYMTATLADDTILVSNFKAVAAEVSKPIRPKGGGDIGDRMILAPQEINPEYTIEDIRSLISVVSKSRNVVVIVPSKARSEFWKTVAAQIVDKDNLGKAVEKLKKGHVGLTVLINKYDGIDLPGNSCEMLVIDGLPEVYGLIERLEMLVLDGTKRQLVGQIQRIEQGMGRGVRSSDDHCVVLLLGGRLTQRIHQPESDEMFSTATRAQIELGRQVSSQVQGKPLEDLLPILNLCFHQDDQWVGAGRNAIVNSAGNPGANLDSNQVSLRTAFDKLQIGRQDLAVKHTQDAVDGAKEEKEKGYFMQLLAEQTNYTDPAKAQELQLASLAKNSRLLKPIRGATYNRISAPPDGQAVAAALFMKRFLEGNDLSIWTNSLLDDLNWGEEGSKRFEAAMCDLGSFLGFGSERPEEKVGRGPDNMWALGDLEYLVIECKSGAVIAEKICKADTNQLNGSMVWFEDKYDSTCTMTPIIVHPKTIFEYAASPHPDIRIINGKGLTRLRKAILDYSVSISSNGSFRDINKIQQQLDYFNLSAQKIVSLCTVAQNSK